MEGRFSHLLQPIRDLTKNWDVDIASHLEDYLEEIEHVAISFDGGSTTMNFAEAALLIQGSTSVYSKKVEYLYSLVFQVMDLLASKKKLQHASSVDGQGNDKDATFANNNRGHEEFLTLDDVKEAKSVIMKDENQNTVMVVPNTPLALVKVGEGCKGDNPLISKTGEVLGNRKDFKLNKSIVHRDGSALLDLSHLCMLEMSFASHPHSTPFPKRTQQKADEESKEGDAADQPPAENQDMGPLPALDISGDDNDIGGFDMPEPMEDTNMQPQEQQVKRVRMAEAKKKVKAYLLPLATHADSEHTDPHEEHNLGVKPFKKGKTFRVPTKVQTETQRRKRKKQEPRNNNHCVPLIEYINNAFFSKAKSFPKDPLKAPGLIEFEHLFWREHFRRQTKIKRERRKLVEQGRVQELHDNLEEEQQAAAEAEVNDLGNDLGDDGDDLEPGDLEIPDMQFPEVQELGALDFGEEGAGVHADTDQMQQDLGSVSVVTSYEDLVRQHVEGFMTSAQVYAQITELTRRVQEWEEKIVPKLRQQEEHEAFDIHEYGSRILDSVTTNTNKEKIKRGTEARTIKVPFRKVVEGKAPFQVCRYFLSTLQLANNYNVEITNSGNLEKAMDSMGLKLLSTKRHFEELEEYQAPSLKTTH